MYGDGDRWDGDGDVCDGDGVGMGRTSCPLAALYIQENIFYRAFGLYIL